MNSLGLATQITPLSFIMSFELNRMGVFLSNGVSVFADVCDASQTNTMRMSSLGRSGYDGLTKAFYE